MRLLIQRVREAAVTVDNRVVSSIANGMLVFCGFGYDEKVEDFTKTAQKLSLLRIFPDESGMMNLSLKDISGSVLVVSQFTLYGQTKKGNRPSFIKSAPSEKARLHYDTFVKSLEEVLPGKISTGIFGANMQVQLINDGPVTLWIDSENPE